MANILIGISGSIAAYKIPGLIHELKQHGHTTKIILTGDAANFVTPTALAAFGADIYTDNSINPYRADSIMQHIELARWPDIIVIAPLSANTLGKIAGGLADNLLSSTILATTKPVYLVPAMNMHMWNNALVRDNVNKLIHFGYKFWGPDTGLQACGDNGDGRMLEPSEILTNIQHTLLCATPLFADKAVIITAGPTLEAIDPVRYLSNYSSGKMGYALARAFTAHGAKVTLIAGNTSLETPNCIEQFIRVNSAQEMYSAAMEAAAGADLFIGCAAVCDYRCNSYSENKIKKSGNTQLNLSFTANPDIIAGAKQKFPQLKVVGFAAETQNLPEYAADKLQRKNLDLIIANPVGNGAVFGSDSNDITIIGKHGISLTATGSKDILAHKIVAACAELF